MGKYFLFDTETGGLPEQNASLLTFFGMILDKNLNPSYTIDLKIKPDDGVYRITPKALEINKINIEEHDAVAVKQSHAAKQLEDFVTKYNMSSDKLIPAGHNVSFDIFFGKQLLPNWSRHFNHRVMDSASTARFLKYCGLLPDNFNCQLTEMGAYFDHPINNAHNAEFDVRLNLKVFKSLKQLVKGQK